MNVTDRVGREARRRSKSPARARGKAKSGAGTRTTRSGSKTAAQPGNASPGPSGGKRPRISEKRARLNEALSLELHALRSALDRILQGYEVKVGGQIAELLERLEGDESLGQPARPLTVARAQAALDEIAGVSIRPDRARLRDLRRIRRLVRRLREQIPD